MPIRISTSVCARIFGTTVLLLLGLGDSPNLHAAPQNVDVYARAGIQGTPISGYAASFTVSENNPSIASLSAVIDWGDGSVTAGTIELSVIAGVYTVSDTHTYLSAGSYTISVTVSDFTDNGSSTNSNTATIQDAPLIVAGLYFDSKPHVGFNELVATFVDDNPYATIVDLSAMINWGDGSSLSPASAIARIGLSDSYNVFASHTYSAPGLKVVTITVNDGNNQNVAAGTSYTGDRIFANGFDS